MPAGRPTKLTKETLDKLRQAFAIDCTVEEACFYANISEDVFYKWKREDQELIKDIERLRLKPILKARQEIVSGLDGFDNALKFLERKRKKEFSLRQEYTGSDGKDLPQPIINVYRDNSDNKGKES